MNIVYKMTFLSRLENNTPPFYYIGMKTNCSFKDNIILGKNEKPYWSSSGSSKFMDCLKLEFPLVEILFESENQDDVCKKERELLCEVDARHNPNYFNMTNGTVDPTFHSSDYASYRHKDNMDVYKRLKRNDPLVLSGEFVGTTKGIKGKWKIDSNAFGEKNSFYGKTHSDETKKYLSYLASQQHLSKTKEDYLVFSQSRKGLKNSDYQKQQSSKAGKGKVMLANPFTGECKRISRFSEEYNSLISEGWENPTKNKKTLKCPLSGDTEQVLINSERCLYLESLGWFPPTKNKLLLKDPKTETIVSVIKNSEEHDKLLYDGWISPSKGKISLKDPISGVCKKVMKNSEECILLESEGWMNPHKLKTRLKNEENSKN